MHTLVPRDTLDPNRIAAFRTGGEHETPAIRAFGGRVASDGLPADRAGPAEVGCSPIAFETLAADERSRGVLDADPAHRRNAAALAESGALPANGRSFGRRHGDAEARTPVGRRRAT